MPRRPVQLRLQRSNDPPLLILTSLAEGPKHGHALAKDIEAFAGVRLGPGALYGAITRLEERGLIEPLASRDRRRPYRITPAGTATLGQAVADMRRLADVGAARLGRSSRAAPRTVVVSGGELARLLRWYPPAWRERSAMSWMPTWRTVSDLAGRRCERGCRSWPAGYASAADVQV